MLKLSHRAAFAAVCFVSVSGIALAQGAGDGATKERPATGQTSPTPSAPRTQPATPPAAKPGTGATTQQAPSTTTTKPGAGGQKPAAQQGTTGADAKAGAAADVKLDAQQETKLRSVVKTTKIREVNNINVSISVGTVLPATIVLEPIPTEIVTIVPRFRGYRVIRVGSRILIVHPDTRRIVYIINV